ncbi:MAG: tetratricopeptide repeat protein [Bacteroidota bacterium]
MKNRLIHKTLFTIIAYLTIISSFSFAWQSDIDSLENLLINAKEDTSKIKILNTLARYFWYADPDTAIIISSIAKDLSENINDRKFLAHSLNTLGVPFEIKGDYAIASGYYNRALSIYDQLGFKKGASTVLNNLGLVSYYQSNYPKALDHFFKSLAIATELSDKGMEARAYNNIGMVYESLNDFSEALKYYFQSLEIKESLNNKRGSAATLNNIGLIYMDQDLYSKALDYYIRAMEINEEMDNKSWLATNLNNIGMVYDEQGDLSAETSARQAGLSTDDSTCRANYSKALEYYTKALRIREEIDNKEGITASLIGIGSIKIKMGGIYDPGILKILERSYKISREIETWLRIKETCILLSDLYSKQNNFKLALQYYKESALAKDSLFNEEKSKDLGKLEAKHEFEMQEMELKKTEEEQARIQAVQESRSNNLQYSGIFVFILALFIGIIAIGIRKKSPLEGGLRGVSPRLAEGLVFFTFLLFFEFTLVLLDPYIEQYSSGAPAIKLGFNALLAGLIFPLHSFFESKLKSRIAKTKGE